ncbi:MAG: hypothetical protein MSIBF_02080 [Candidatus Altiarchaeales archaeon IMC4]|nr:MAG: hypothetical protein MSIBF_02080 [Candidatus Altiarchaeales archaeon IMC4]
MHRTTPNLKPETMELDIGYANNLLGTDLSPKEAAELLEKMRYRASPVGGKITVEVPPYRTDVLHPIDLVEDIAIAYGYERFKPKQIDAYTVGKKDPPEAFSDKARQVMIGAGFQEVMTLIMTNPVVLFDKMCIERRKSVEALNPVSSEHSITRTWLMPSLMEILEKNKNREYPQMLFEIGQCIGANGKDSKKLAGVIANSDASFSQVKAAVVGILDALGADYKFESYAHGSFIKGRCARVMSSKSSGLQVIKSSGLQSSVFGFMGEVSPDVLSNFGVGMPVCAFELDIDSI